MQALTNNLFNMGDVRTLHGEDKVIGNIPSGHDCPEREIHTLFAVLTGRDKLTGEQVMALINRVGDDVVVILNLLDDSPIHPQRKRALWMLTAIHDSVVCLTVPKEFLSSKKFAKREEIRTRAYAYFQAYKLSLEIANEYAKAANPHGFYKEIPNALIAIKNLHDLGIMPRDIWGSSEGDETFFDKAKEIASTIQKGIRTMYLQRTPELDALLEPFRIRLVK